MEASITLTIDGREHTVRRSGDTYTAQMNRTPAMNGGESSAVKFPTTIYRMEIGAKPVKN